jgi:hypothetical protein
MSLEKLDKIVKSSEAKLCLMDETVSRFKTTTAITGLFGGSAKWPAHLRYEKTDGIGKKGIKGRTFDEYSVTTDSLAFLQYTSGSTVSPQFAPDICSASFFR